MTSIYQAVVSTFKTGQGTVGTSAQQLDSTSYGASLEIQIYPAPGNSGTIYVGNSSSVTTSTGFEVPASGVSLGLADVSDIYVIGSGAGQDYSWIAT